jgi:hypothetical protein
MSVDDSVQRMSVELGQQNTDLVLAGQRELADAIAQCTKGKVRLKFPPVQREYETPDFVLLSYTRWWQVRVYRDPSHFGRSYRALKEEGYFVYRKHIKNGTGIIITVSDENDAAT